MKISKLDDMTRGWFVGNFVPTLYQTNDCEVAVKQYKVGDCEEKHYHKIATEITVVVMGRVIMFGKEFEKGDIIIAEPFDETGFEAVEDSILCVVKIPGAQNDKYICERMEKDA